MKHLTRLFLILTVACLPLTAVADDGEEATGATRREAMNRLREATRLYQSDGCP